MGNARLIVVHPPDGEGARQVTIGMARRVVRSREELARFLRENGLSGDVSDPQLIEWRGGGSRTWGRPGTGPSDNASWRRRATATLMAGGLLTAGVLFAVIGARDTWEALTYVGRIAGASFFVVSFIALAAAASVASDYCLRRRWRFSAAVILLAVLTVLATNVLLLAVQVAGREFTAWFAFWFGLTIWSGWALWELLHRQRVWSGIPHRKRFAAVLSISALIAAANFSYVQIYKPYATPIVISNSVKFGTPHLTPGGRTVQIPLTLQFDNVGEWPAYIVAASYEVLGFKQGYSRETPRAAEAWRPDIEDGRLNMNVYADSRTSAPQPIAHELIVEPAYVYMEPGDSFTDERVVEMPAGHFNVIQAHSKVIAMRKDRASMIGEPGGWKRYSWKEGEEVPPWVAEEAKTPKRSDYIAYRIPLKYSNEVLNLTRNSRYLTLWWMLGKGEEYGFKLVDTVALDGEEGVKRDTLERLRDRDKYGLVNIDSGFVQAFVAVEK
ncbi:hypothetical protein [Streptomyces sp. NPDC092307]|uniref:hypothetical protein n=1 Tax=Streptomyces sp. NPDC092307 TaxID=3366013 RepID=UPI0037FD1226